MKESLKYLALPSEERIKLQAQPFDGKKQCWVPDAKESFVAAEITATKGEEVTAKTEKGDVSFMNSNANTFDYDLFSMWIEHYIEKRWCSANEST